MIFRVSESPRSLLLVYKEWLCVWYYLVVSSVLSTSTHPQFYIHVLLFLVLIVPLDILFYPIHGSDGAALAARSSFALLSSSFSCPEIFWGSRTSCIIIIFSFSPIFHLVMEFSWHLIFLHPSLGTSLGRRNSITAPDVSLYLSTLLRG